MPRCAVRVMPVFPIPSACFTCQSDMASHRGWPAHTSAARHARTARKQKPAREHLTTQSACLASAATETKPFQPGVLGLFRSQICHLLSAICRCLHALPRGDKHSHTTSGLMGLLKLCPASADSGNPAEEGRMRDKCQRYKARLCQGLVYGPQSAHLPPAEFKHLIVTTGLFRNQLAD